MARSAASRAACKSPASSRHWASCSCSDALAGLVAIACWNTFEADSWQPASASAQASSSMPL